MFRLKRTRIASRETYRAFYLTSAKYSALFINTNIHVIATLLQLVMCPAKVPAVMTQQGRVTNARMAGH